MLVLTRKQDTAIRIGNDIVIHVIKTGKGTVKIGIEAPRDVRVVRAELTPLSEVDLSCVSSVADVPLTLHQPLVNVA